MAEKKVKPVKLLRKQPINRKVVFALLPCVFGAVYYFGWRSLAVIAFATVVGFVTEYIFCKTRSEPVSEAVFVTTFLFALIMPPAVPWHVVFIGVVFAIMFGKEVFGGFGRNIFNPAMAGRCFVYVCFPVAMTGMWSKPAAEPWGALNRWSTTSADATTGATPMGYLKYGQLSVADEDISKATDQIPFDIAKNAQVTISKSTLFKGLALGRISGTMGVTSAVLILIGGLYLFIWKVASRATILSTVITYAVLNQILFWFGVDPVPGAWPAVMGGGFLLGAFYMATDPVSSPKTTEARIIYGIIIASCTTVIRNFSIFYGGLMFSILIGNMFAPVLDYWVKQYKASAKAKKAEGAKA